MSKAERKAFMSSKISKVADTKKPASSSNKSSGKRNRTDDSGSIESAEDGKYDRELSSLLTTSKLLEKYKSDKLVGKDRLRANQQKLIELGVKAPKAQKMPRTHLYGKIAHRRERAEKTVERARERGILTDSMKKDIMARARVVSAGVADKDSMREAKYSKNGVRKVKWSEKGLNTSGGTYKNGTLHIPKSKINEIENLGKRKGGRGSGAGAAKRIRL
ncbi:hypothetical protein GQ42DRAFT_162508 [Ramicandelaber brevisporus]|nr:hypothetical protein GQ42DRAFT_162508 [Ramicandelaber brevisporus]